MSVEKAVAPAAVPVQSAGDRPQAICAGRAAGATACVAALAALAACAPPSSNQRPAVGQRLVEGAGQALLVAPAGGAAVYLKEPHHPEGKLMPPDAFLGQLTLVTADGQTRDLGGNATNLGGAVLFAPDGRHVAYLKAFDFATHEGELNVVDVAGGEPRSLAPHSAFFGFSPDGSQLGYVALGKLMLLPLAGAAPAQLAAGVATFEFSADGQSVLYRGRGEDGAVLVLAPTAQLAVKRVHGDPALHDGSQPVTVARRVADYQFDRKGQAIAYTLQNADGLPELHLWKGGTDRLLGTGAPSFSFAPDGRALAYVANVSAHYLEGDLFVVAVAGENPPAGSPALPVPQKVGARAGTYVFSPDGDRLAFLHDYYDSARSGKLAVWQRAGSGKGGRFPTGFTTEVSEQVTYLGWSHRGAQLAWLKTVTRPLYTEELHLAEAAQPKESRLIGTAIYSFDFSPDDQQLFFKSGCVSGGAACDLMLVSTDPTQVKLAQLGDGGAGLEKATRVAAGLADYDYSPDGHWMWVTFLEPLGHTVDLAVLPRGEWGLPRYVDHGAEPHPRWLASGKLAYFVNSPKRAGFYEGDPALAVAVTTSRRR